MFLIEQLPDVSATKRNDAPRVKESERRVEGGMGEGGGGLREKAARRNEIFRLAPRRVEIIEMPNPCWFTTWGAERR